MTGYSFSFSSKKTHPALNTRGGKAERKGQEEREGRKGKGGRTERKGRGRK